MERNWLSLFSRNPNWACLSPMWKVRRRMKKQGYSGMIKKHRFDLFGKASFSGPTYYVISHNSQNGNMIMIWLLLWILDRSLILDAAFRDLKPTVPQCIRVPQPGHSAYLVSIFIPFDLEWLLRSVERILKKKKRWFRFIDFRSPTHTPNIPRGWIRDYCIPISIKNYLIFFLSHRW